MKLWISCEIFLVHLQSLVLIEMKKAWLPFSEGQASLKSFSTSHPQ